MSTKKTKKQSKADADFIEKIKSIQIGGKPLGQYPCPGCGVPIDEHKIEVKVVPIPAGFFMADAIARRNAMNN